MPTKSQEAAERDRRRIEHFRARVAAAHPEYARRGWKADLAERTKIHPSVISRLLKGSRPVPTEHMITVAQVLGDPELIPPDLRTDGAPPASGPRTTQLDAPPRMSGTRSRLPPGLEGFFERHPEISKNKRIRWYLENTSNRTEEWVTLTDTWWLEQANIWKRYLSELEQEGGTESRKSHRNSGR